jgi:hypothetical protein
MFEAIESAAGAAGLLLNLALSFHDKSMATEEAFSSAPTLSCDERSIGMVATCLGYGKLKLMLPR